MPMIPASEAAEADRGGQATVRVLCSEAEISTCAEAWKRFQKHPNADWDFYWHINEVHNQSDCILELRQNGEIRSLWLGRIEPGHLPIRLGYIKLGGMKVTRLNIITGGVLGDDSEEACRLLLLRALQVMPEKRIDLLVLSYLPRGHVLARLATRLPRWCCRDWGVVPTIHWRMTLPPSFDEFLKKRSKKHRYWLNRLPRVLDDAYPGQISIRAFRDPGEIGDFCRDAGTIARSTYQHRLGEAFRPDEDYRTRCRLLAEKGAVRGYILYVSEQPKAYWMATVSHDTVYLNLTGYDPKLRKYEIGTVLLMKLFEDHCGTTVRKVDFGHGGAVYKERFGDESFDEASVRVYRLTPTGLLANLLAGTNAKLEAVATALLAKLGLLQRVKTIWRRRLGA